MLTCLTHEDATRLLRKMTLKGFFQQLLVELARTPGESVVDGEPEWCRISGAHHHLSRECNTQGQFSDWATWSDLQSMHPLLMASWSWWQPLLQGAVSVLELPRTAVLTLTEGQPDLLWAVVAAVHTRGVDEIYLVGEAAQSTWQSLLEPLPVVLQCAELSKKNPESIKPASILPAHWYRLYGILNRLCQELNGGHRVNFDQNNLHADQYLNRLLLY